MSQDAVLAGLLALLHELGISSMLTGSYASNIYGRIRSTFDADIVVALRAPDLRRLLAALGDDFYVDAASIAEVREAGGHFNAVHKPSGLKIDFYLPRGAHDRAAMRRRKVFRLWDMDVAVIAPEDLILAKLVWAGRGASARHVEDARGVYELQKDELDIGYLKSGAQELSVGELLASILT